MTLPSSPAPLEDTLEGQIGPLLPQLSAWFNHIGIAHVHADDAVSMTKRSGDIEFDVTWEELPGLLVGFISLLEPLQPGEKPEEALALLESIEEIPPRYIEVASYSVVGADQVPGLYLRLRMPLRFAPETAADALELISYMADRHAEVIEAAS